MSDSTVTLDSRPARRGPLGWSRTTKIVSAIVGAALAGTAAYAATNWAVNLSSGSNGTAQSGSVTNISITAVASPSPSNLLYPGGSGDVVAKVTNPNPIPVTITAVNLPASTAYAAGYTDSGLGTAQTGCSTSTSYVGWAFATTSGSSHTLTNPITVAANGSITMTFTNDATMGTNAATACQSTFFSMPSLTGVTASAGAGTASTFNTDAWTS